MKSRIRHEQFRKATKWKESLHIYSPNKLGGCVICHVAVQKAVTSILVALLLSLIYHHKSYEKIGYVAIYKCVILIILHIFKIIYQLGNIEQCYLPGKMADNMHSHEKSDHFMLKVHPTFCPVSALLPPTTTTAF